MSFRTQRGLGARAEGGKFKLNQVMAADALLLGRRTYKGFAEACPSRTGESADKFNTMPKNVVLSTLEHPAWSNSMANAKPKEADLNPCCSRGRRRAFRRGRRP